eukprot:GGOE01000975.1.p1 GENE.GGOE01000975.1~~GGOE01000975.1.p1  ORF type:complete len:285 (+),score=35.31 GGOE01000975.1:37-855(+)
MDDDSDPLACLSEDLYTSDAQPHPPRPVPPRRNWLPDMLQLIDRGQPLILTVHACSHDVEVEQEYMANGTGSCVWDSSLVMVHFFENSLYFPAKYWHGKVVVELGSGTGMCGILCAMLGARVILTDREANLSLCRTNMERNTPALEALCSPQPAVQALHWGDASDVQRALTYTNCDIDVILCCDLLLPYAPELQQPLVQTINVLLRSSRRPAQALFCYQVRFDVQTFFDEVASAQLICQEVSHDALHPEYQAEDLRVFILQPQPKAAQPPQS